MRNGLFSSGTGKRIRVTFKVDFTAADEKSFPMKGRREDQIQVSLKM